MLQHLPCMVIKLCEPCTFLYMYMSVQVGKRCDGQQRQLLLSRTLNDAFRRFLMATAQTILLLICYIYFAARKKSKKTVHWALADPQNANGTQLNMN
jgi:hypothetical protein